LNYLAHAYLSFNQPEILVGNMISDFVKGKKKFDYPAGIQKGIALHRSIDVFTDDHPVTAKAKIFFRPAYRLYAGAFIDVVYDHFLAKQLEPAFLESFTADTYTVLENYLGLLPERFQQLFPYMKKENWLYNYRFEWGTEKSFGGLVRRARYLESETAAIAIFHQHYNELSICFNDFFPRLERFSLERYKELLRA
jgi:acyl carrier protein phosphodiesterase